MPWQHSLLSTQWLKRVARDNRLWGLFLEGGWTCCYFCRSLVFSKPERRLGCRGVLSNLFRRGRGLIRATTGKRAAASRFRGLAIEIQLVRAGDLVGGSDQYGPTGKSGAAPWVEGGRSNGTVVSERENLGDNAVCLAFRSSLMGRSEKKKQLGMDSGSEARMASFEKVTIQPSMHLGRGGGRGRQGTQPMDGQRTSHCEV